MKIIHISMGNPFTHEGGLNRYCLDLYKTQKQMGHKVAIVFPGICTKSKKISIKQIGKGIYKIDHALPVPITYGIDMPQRYMVPVSINEYYSFLSHMSPDVVHVHSFMGIHREFFVACQMLEIPVVLTTHDYYPFCFKCNLVDCFGNLCIDGFEDKKCSICNNNCGLGYKTQLLMQTQTYQNIKNNKILKGIKKNVKKSSSSDIDCSISNTPKYSFSSLHNYYSDIMSMVSVVHCNSLVSKKLYEKAYPDNRYKIIPITHCGIKKSRHIRQDSNKLRISYFGGASSHKGYDQLKEVLSLLPEDNSWEINLYGGLFPDEICDNRVHAKGYFTKEEEQLVWDSTDLLLFISQWPESFGFSVLESLSMTIPVICSELAGASVLLDGIEECIYTHSDTNELAKKIEFFLKMNNYSSVQNRIEHLSLDVTMTQHAEKIVELYKEVTMV